MVRNALHLLACAAGLTTILFATAASLDGQGRGRGATGAATAATARAAAPFDPTGYWVSVVTGNWRLRMVPPAKGDYIGIPISAAGKKIADAWDMAKDEAAGNECKHYGAASIMYQPTRLRVTWQDDNTLRMETDAGTQTRVFEFGNRPASQPRRRSWQGSSSAVWEARRGGRAAASARYLKVTTANMLSGYLRKNGVPYSENAVLTEYYDLFQEKNGDVMMFVTAVVEDPTYLDSRYVVISHFKREPDGSKWDPTPCSARW
jgi:hypothetical protein